MESWVGPEGNYWTRGYVGTGGERNKLSNSYYVYTIHAYMNGHTPTRICTHTHTHTHTFLAADVAFFGVDFFSLSLSSPELDISAT